MRDSRPSDIGVFEALKDKPLWDRWTAAGAGVLVAAGVGIGFAAIAGSITSGAALGAGMSLVSTSIVFVGALSSHAARVKQLAMQNLEHERLAVGTTLEAARIASQAESSGVTVGAAASLHALIDLHRTELAAALLSELWSSDRFSPGAAVVLVDRLLRSASRPAQLRAAVALRLNAESLIRVVNEGEHYDWPDCVNQRWLPDLEVGTRRHLMMAWMKMWTTDGKYTRLRRPTILASGLLAIYESELSGAGIGESSELRDCAAQCLEEAVAFIVRPTPPTRFVAGRSVTFDSEFLARLKARSHGEIRNSEFAWVVTRVREWVDGGCIGIPWEGRSTPA